MSISSRCCSQTFKTADHIVQIVSISIMYQNSAALADAFEKFKRHIILSNLWINESSLRIHFKRLSHARHKSRASTQNTPNVRRRATIYSCTLILHVTREKERRIRIIESSADLCWLYHFTKSPSLFIEHWRRTSGAVNSSFTRLLRALTHISTFALDTFSQT